MALGNLCADTMVLSITQSSGLSSENSVLPRLNGAPGQDTEEHITLDYCKSGGRMKADLPQPCKVWLLLFLKVNQDYI